MTPVAPAMKLLPIAVNLQGKRCLIVGGGPVALRKVRATIECGGSATVVAPSLCQGFTPLLGIIDYRQRAFQEGDCQGQSLVFAATNDREVNSSVAREALRRAIWCNVADDAAASDFHSAAAVRRGDITIGITTSAGSPALARHLKAVIQESIGPEYEQLLQIVSARRPALADQLEGQPRRAELWGAVMASDALDLIRAGRHPEAEAIVDRLLDTVTSQRAPVAAAG